MGSFKAQIKIDATKEEVWEVLADLGNIYRWAPGVTYSCSTSEEGQGEGATRHCDIQLGPIKGYLEERAFDWRDGEGFKIEIYASSLPAKRIIVQFTVRADGDGTVVEVSPEFQLKFGVLGVVMDRLMFGPQFRKGFSGLLAGLKHYVETGEVVTDRIPKSATSAA